MDEVLEQLQATARKAAQLEQAVQRLLKQREGMKAELTLLREQLAAQEQAYTLLEEKYEASKLAKNLSSPADRVALQDKIDNYLKEIDICLKKFGVQD